VLCSALQCVAVCCSVLQYVAVRYSVLQCAPQSTAGLKRSNKGAHRPVDVRLNLRKICVCVLQWCSMLQCGAICCSVLQCAAVCCSVLQCVAVCCSVLQCVPQSAASLQRSNKGAHRHIDVRLSSRENFHHPTGMLGSDLRVCVYVCVYVYGCVCSVYVCVCVQ